MNRLFNLGLILFVAWLLLAHAWRFLNLAVPVADAVVAVLGISAGALLLVAGLGQSRGRVTSRALGLVLLGAWLVLSQLFPLVDMAIEGPRLVLHALAAAAGLLLLAGRQSESRT